MKRIDEVNPPLSRLCWWPAVLSRPPLQILPLLTLLRRTGGGGFCPSPQPPLATPRNRIRNRNQSHNRSQTRGLAPSWAGAGLSVVMVVAVARWLGWLSGLEISRTPLQATCNWETRFKVPHNAGSPF